MVYCSISNCGNSSKMCNITNKGITFHMFPKDPDIKHKWISASGKRNWFPTNYSRICSVHFTNEQFNSSTKRRTLIKSAVPTVDIWRLTTVTDDLKPMVTPSTSSRKFPEVVDTTAKLTITLPYENDSSDTSSDSGDEHHPTLGPKDKKTISSELSNPERSQRKTTKRKAVSKKEDDSSDLPSVCGDDRPPTFDSEDEGSGGFQCNECFIENSGFRYTCVQCTDWDLCAECDKRGAHAHHFVLRVPRGCNFSKAKMVKQTVFNSLIRLFKNQAEVELIPTDTIIEFVKEEVIDEEEDNKSDGDFSLYTESALKEQEKIFYRNFVPNPIKSEHEESDNSLFIEPEQSCSSIEPKTEQGIPDTIQHEPLRTSDAPRRPQVIGQIIPIVKKSVPPKKPIAKKSMSQNHSEPNPIAQDDDVTVTQPREGARYIVVDCGMPVLGASNIKVKTETIEPKNDDLNDLIVQSKIRKLS